MSKPWVWNTGYRRVGLTGVVKPEGAPRPRYYFYGFEDFDRDERVFFPFGVHWLVQLARDARYAVNWLLFKTSRLSFSQRADYAAYWRGYERGRASILQDVTTKTE